MEETIIQMMCSIIDIFVMKLSLVLVLELVLQMEVVVAILKVKELIVPNVSKIS